MGRKRHDVNSSTPLPAGPTSALGTAGCGSSRRATAIVPRGSLTRSSLPASGTWGPRRGQFPPLSSQNPVLCQVVKVGEGCPYCGPLSPVGPVHAPRAQNCAGTKGSPYSGRALGGRPWVCPAVRMLLASWQNPDIEKGGSSSLRGPQSVPCILGF